MQAFSSVDVAGTGVLNLEQVRQLLETQLQRALHNVEWENWASRYCTSEDGTMDLNQYVGATVCDQSFTVEVGSH